jgi:hypothetical protein
VLVVFAVRIVARIAWAAQSAQSRKTGRLLAQLGRAGFWLPIEAFVLVFECGSCAVSQLSNRDDIHAIEVFTVPVLYILRFAASWRRNSLFCTRRHSYNDAVGFDPRA